MRLTGRSPWTRGFRVRPPGGGPAPVRRAAGVVAPVGENLPSAVIAVADGW
nr:MAG TPA: hypothetical protein [Caudoviricetes sp.]